MLAVHDLQGMATHESIFVYLNLTHTHTYTHRHTHTHTGMAVTSSGDSGDSDNSSGSSKNSSDSDSNSGNDSDSSSDKKSSSEDEDGDTVTHENGDTIRLGQDKDRVSPQKNMNFGESIRCGLLLDKEHSTPQTSGVHLYHFDCLIDFDVV